MLRWAPGRPAPGAFTQLCSLREEATGAKWLGPASLRSSCWPRRTCRDRARHVSWLVHRVSPAPGVPWSQQHRPCIAAHAVLVCRLTQAVGPRPQHGHSQPGRARRTPALAAAAAGGAATLLATLLATLGHTRLTLASARPSKCTARTASTPVCFPGLTDAGRHLVCTRPHSGALGEVCCRCLVGLEQPCLQPLVTL